MTTRRLAAPSLALLPVLAGCLGGAPLEEGEAAFQTLGRHALTLTSKITTVRIDEPHDEHVATMTIEALLDLSESDPTHLGGTLSFCSVTATAEGRTLTLDPGLIAEMSGPTMTLQRDDLGAALVGGGFTMRFGQPAQGDRPARGFPLTIQTEVMGGGSVSANLVLGARVEVTGWWPSWQEGGGLRGQFAARDAFEVLYADGIPPALAEAVLDGQRAKFRVAARDFWMTTTPVDPSTGCGGAF